MALESQPGKALENLVEDLKVGVTSKVNEENTTGAKDSTSDATSCISSGDASSSIKERELDQEALVAEQSMHHIVNGVSGYYYPGFDGSMAEWEGNRYFVGTDGLEIQYSDNQSENGPLVYYLPGFQAGYYPYSPFSPGAMVGVDGQYFTQQPYYTSPILHQPSVFTGFFPQSIDSGHEFVPAYAWDSVSTCVDGIYGNGYGRDSSEPYPKPYFSSQSHVIKTSKATVPARSSAFGKKAAATEIDLSLDATMENHAFKQVTKVNTDRSFHPTNKVHSNRSPGKNILQYPNMAGIGKSSGRTLVGIERLKAANQSNGIGETLNKQNRGPRTLGGHGVWFSGYAASTGSEANNNSNCTMEATINKEDYNVADFCTKYDHAYFFVIKSYSEDDIHKSIKYNVWASTPNGNKRLDNAFQGALGKEKGKEKETKCPVFLFFSVNASGQFCGVAEMIGRVDFNQSMDFWQQDKWNGYFPVRWHIIKDIPNPEFRHIILENNENKPVTNSRDAQEVNFLQGSEMLCIFKNYSSKTSILEDFGFYESRQKTMQDKRINPFRSEATAKFTQPASQKNIPSNPQLLEGGTENKEEFPHDLLQQ